MEAPIDANKSEQSAPNQTTMTERTEKTKYIMPILSDRKTDLTKINPRMWREQIRNTSTSLWNT